MSNLIDDINKAANTIHQRTLRGSGNFIIVSKQVADAMQMDYRQDVRKEKIKKIFKDLFND